MKPVNFNQVASLKLLHYLNFFGQLAYVAGYFSHEILESRNELGAEAATQTYGGWHMSPYFSVMRSLSHEMNWVLKLLPELMAAAGWHMLPYVSVVRSSSREMNWVLKRSGIANTSLQNSADASGDDFIVRLSGLPVDFSHNEFRDFLEGQTIQLSPPCSGLVCVYGHDSCDL